MIYRHLWEALTVWRNESGVLSRNQTPLTRSMLLSDPAVDCFRVVNQSWQYNSWLRLGFYGVSLVLVHTTKYECPLN